MKLLKTLVLILLVIIVSDVYSQPSKQSSSGKKKKNKPLFLNIYASMGAGELSTFSFYGPVIGGGLRKTVININKHMNCSFDTHLGNQIAFITLFETDKNIFSIFPFLTMSFNFNAGTGTYPAGKKQALTIPIGGFLGPGILVLPNYSNNASGINSRGTGDGKVSVSYPDFGPMANFGFRFKTSKTYFFEFRVYAGYTIFGEVAMGGGGFHFPIGMGKQSNKRN